MTLIKEFKNISYGPYERNLLDAYIVDREGVPSPVLIYFHGGGYVGGDKEDPLFKDLKEECLKLGISAVTCNYRFITTDPFPAPMNDGARAIQFIRHKAHEWGIDPDRIATSGASAGGHIALWNALRGDLKNQASHDPIEQTSSNVAAFIGFATQVTKDQRFYEGIYDGPYIQPNLALFYGVTEENLFEPETLKLAENASAINYMSEKAPPAFMVYDYKLNSKIPTNADVNEVIYHPVHGLALKQKYDDYKIPYVLKTLENPVHPGEIGEFLLKIFKIS